MGATITFKITIGLFTTLVSPLISWLLQPLASTPVFCGISFPFHPFSMEWGSMIIAVLGQEYYIHRPSSFFKCERTVIITHYQMEVFPKRTDWTGEAFFDLQGESSSFLTSSRLWRSSQAYSASTYLVLLWHCFFLSLRKVSVLKLILWKLSLDFILHSGELRTETSMALSPLI